MPAKLSKAEKKAASKAKKAERKAVVLRERAQKKVVADCNALTNVLEGFEAFCTVKLVAAAPAAEAAAAADEAAAPAPASDDASLPTAHAITFARACDLDDATRVAIFGLLKTNMEAKYDAAWGWSDKEKKKEQNEEDARFCLVRSPAGDLIAFSHFRFSLEGVYKVIYIYEVQVDATYRSQGLGKRLVQLLELLAVKKKMEWTMCTVFKCNERSMSFFTGKMKYEIDETSPSMADVYEEATYEILSKNLMRKAKLDAVARAAPIAATKSGWEPGMPLPVEE